MIFLESNTKFSFSVFIANISLSIGLSVYLSVAYLHEDLEATILEVTDGDNTADAKKRKNIHDQ